MSEKWCGSVVSVDCGEVLGVYEGEVSQVDLINQTIKLKNVTRNSAKSQVTEVTLRSRDIKELKILRSSVNEQNKSNHSLKQTKQSAFAEPAKQKKNITNSPMQDENSKKKELKKKTPSKRIDTRKWQQDKDAACFSVQVDSNVFDTDFDFEKNLALFDKKAVFNEINAHSKSDNTVRLVDCNRRTQQNYRHDENVLVSAPSILRQITVPCESSKEYVTDSGLIIPTISQEFREQLFKKAEELGLATEVRLEMTGRAGSEMVLQMLGGNYRLNPQNSHQRPTVVVLCGYHTQGVQGLICARHLANHQVNVFLLYSPETKRFNKWFPKEMNLFSLTGGTKSSDLSVLPTAVDIIVSCLDTHDYQQEDSWLKATTSWANDSKAPILCLDPRKTNYLLTCKWILWPVLPFAGYNKNFSIYICDIGLPKDVFSQLESSYTSPFGSKFVIPLYTSQ